MQLLARACGFSLLLRDSVPQNNLISGQIREHFADWQYRRMALLPA
jgi:hypothetical protein